MNTNDVNQLKELYSNKQLKLMTALNELQSELKETQIKLAEQEQKVQLMNNEKKEYVQSSRKALLNAIIGIKDLQIIKLKKQKLDEGISQARTEQTQIAEIIEETKQKIDKVKHEIWKFHIKVEKYKVIQDNLN